MVALFYTRTSKKMDLKKIRTEKGITIAQLAKNTGIPRRTLEDIQRRGDCLVSNAVKIAKALDIPLDVLCD